MTAVRICLGTIVLLAATVEAAPPRKNAPAPALPSADKILARLKPTHPRLLADQAQFDALRRQIETDPVLRAADKDLRKNADKLIDAPLPQHVIPDGKRLLATSRAVLDHVYTLAMAYRLHGDRRYADRLWKEMETVAAFSDFNPSHFLDTGEMTHALAIAYDWLYDTWTPAQRKVIRDAMIHMGLEPGLKVYRSGKGWPKADHNWNQVCNGGMTAGALAIGDEEKALATEILRNAIPSVPLAMQAYAPDGAYPEGPGYWGYGTTYNVVMIAMLESALGSDFGLTKAPGFAQTGLFPLYMASSANLYFNFEDAGEKIGRHDAILWLGERFNLPACTWFGLKAGKPSGMGMVWYRGPGEDPQQTQLPLDKYFRKVEVVSMRSSWTDPDALFVAMQSGSNRVNHNHLDLGSFVLDAGGQRWFLDLGGDDYNLPGYFGRQRYDYYRLRAEGHNTLVIAPGNQPDQDPGATTGIRRFVSKPERAFATTDLTAAYPGKARRIERGIALIERKAVVVQDEIDSPAGDIWWFAHTHADITVASDGRSAELKRNGKRLVATLLAPAGAKFEVVDAVPLPSSPKPTKQAVNQNVRKLTVHLAGTSSRLAVVLSPDEASTIKPDAIIPLAKWQ